MKTIRFTAVMAAVAAALTTGSIAWAGEYDAVEANGAPGAPDVYNRVIQITPQTKWVNVAQGEDVKFIDTATGESFVWDFDTTNALSFDLASVAPSGTLG